MKSIDQLNVVPSLTRNALRHDVVVQLMASIFQGTLPAGTRLIIRKLAEQMGISATPIREALVELEAIGVVRFVHNRGSVVKPFGPQQIREIYHLRRILESEAARCSCGQIDPLDLERLELGIRRLLDCRDEDNRQWSEEAMTLDRELHSLIITHCGDARLADELRRYDGLVQTIREIVGNQRQVQQRALEEHLPIIKALLDGDAERAAETMSRHVDSTAAVSIMFG